MTEKPQVILKILNPDSIEFVKKWKHGGYSIEIHNLENAKNHNANVPFAFFPLTESDCEEIFKSQNKIFKKD